MSFERAPNQTDSYEVLGFDAFYRRNLPVVYGYVLRLCGGRIDQAQDLTQETWLSFVDHVRAGHGATLDVRWLITVARSRYIDHWRRQRRQDHKLRLAWESERADPCDSDAPTHAQLSDHLAALGADHRVVLTMRYIDELGVSDIAALIGRTTTATYSLLARARADLRLRAAGETT